MDYMRRIVLFGFPVGYTDMYCKVDEANREKASYFEVEIMLGDKYFAYGFETIFKPRQIYFRMVGGAYKR